MELAIYGKDMFGEPIQQPSQGKIADDFTLPPFSVLNAREGFWQDRKRAWIALGIKSEVGRGSNTLGLSAEAEAYRNGDGDYAKTYNSGAPGALAAQFAAKAAPAGSARPACDYSNRERGSGSGSAIAGTSANAKTSNSGDPGDLAAKYKARAVGTQAWVQQKIGEGDIEGGMSGNQSGTSIFDPVLCELAYRWFCPVGGQIVDPFAGGSVRGIVAHLLDRKYWGADLRQEQIAANEAQAAEIVPENRPQWVCGDSLYVLDDAPEADFIFSCPPYGDLEVYSEDPRDLSAMTHGEFILAYRKIIGKACQKLKVNRFACVVVGDFRDEKGNYRNFVSETIEAFQIWGMRLYNEAILVTAVGSLPIRIGKQFRASRKLGKTHQNVLVFVKGDGKKAAEACGEINK